MIRPELPVRAVIFDVDGTLINSTKVITHTMYDVFVDHLDYHGTADDFRSFIGPPLAQSFATMVDDPKDIETLIRYYRALYAERDHAITLFPGIAQLIEQLSERSIALAVATSKLESSARSLLERLGIAQAMSAICGGDEHSGSSKSDIIAKALCALQSDDTTRGGLTPQSIVMIGDRIFDVEGAKDNDLACLAANWARIARPEEFQDAYAIANEVSDTMSLLGL